MAALLPETRAQLFSWNAKKQAQWDRIFSAGHVSPADGVHLHLAREGDEGQHHWMMTWSSPDFYEGVVIGQLPETYTIATGVVRLVRGERQMEFRQATQAEKPLWYRAIDLTNDQIDAVVLLWKSNRSAIELRFIDAVFRQDGHWYAKDGSVIDNIKAYVPPSQQ